MGYNVQCVLEERLSLDSGSIIESYSLVDVGLLTRSNAFSETELEATPLCGYFPSEAV